MDLRIGQGFDIHRMQAGRPCLVGGVLIPHPSGPLGHSDGDPLLHAVTDALLGAAGLGDIGEHFPDTDPRFLGVASSELLRQAAVKLAERGWRILNVDASVLAEAPRLGPHKRAMAEHIAGLLGLGPDAVNVKAKTMEKLDAIGRGEAIAVHCVALIERRPLPH